VSTDPADTPPLAITGKAHAKVEGFRAGVPDPDAQAMWVEVTGVSGGEFTYNMSLKPVAGAGPGDSVQEHDGLKIVVPAKDVENVRGGTIDWSDDLIGDVAQRVAQVLDQQINPAIAMHGGSAELVAVEDETAYLRLGGGCVGCGMASVTLSQGIEVAILEAVPEIDEVVDVTDHASGTNPYFEAAKK
jgi:Fe/S biogenesis protein NfuA